MRDGTQWRPFVHVEDTSRAFSAVLEADESIVSGEIFNVGSNDQNYQLFPLAQLIAASISVPFAFEWYGSADTRSYVVDFEKIRRQLNFTPRHTPADGAKEIYHALTTGLLRDTPTTHTVEWYKHLLSSHPHVLNVPTEERERS